MTNHEAIRLIRNLPTMCEFADAYGEPIDSDAYYEAVDMAISALQAQEQEERNCSTCKHKEAGIAFWTKETEDAICRDCIDGVYQKWEPQELSNNSPKLDSGNGECKWCENIEDRHLRIEYYWIDDEGNTASFSQPHHIATGIANYCPNCGRKLKDQEESDGNSKD